MAVKNYGDAGVMSVSTPQDMRRYAGSSPVGPNQCCSAAHDALHNFQSWHGFRNRFIYNAILISVPTLELTYEWSKCLS